MNFETEKKNCMEKLQSIDKSRKGSVDREILDLVNLINSHESYYTTSSCSGRIMLITLSSINKKQDVKWLYASHEYVKTADIQSALKEVPKETVWMRAESPIIHICARDLDAADMLLKVANDSGFRRSCILSFRNRVIVEIFFPEKMDVPLSDKGKLLVSGKYLQYLVKSGNERLKSSRKKLKKLEKIFTSLVSKQPKQRT